MCSQQNAASMVHDLGYLMTSCEGYATLLGRDDLATALRQRVSGIVARTVDAFLEMTKEILDYACGGGLHQPVQVELGALINELCDFGG